MPSQIEALRNRVALYRSYLRVGLRGDLAIQYMRQIADDLEAISNAETRKSDLSHHAPGTQERFAQPMGD
jgi:hypothetical protein